MSADEPTAEAIEQIRRAVRQEGVVLEPPEAGWGDWLGAVFGRMLEWFSEIDFGLPSSPAFGQVLLWLLAGLGLVGLGMLVVHLVSRSRQAAAAEPDDSFEDVREPAARDWRVELDRALAEGRLAAALEAIWWLLLTRLDPAHENAEELRGTTGRRAIRASGRSDLLPLVRRLERLSYGREAATRETIEQLADAVEGAFA